MNANELRKAFEQYEPTGEQRRMIRQHIQAEDLEKTRKGIKGIIWRVSAAVCVVCLIAAAALFLRSPRQMAIAPSSPIIAHESAGQNQVQILTLGAGQEEKPQILQIGIEMPLRDYRAESSVMPGFPFTFQWELNEEGGEVYISKGSLLRWDRQTGQVTDIGKKAFCKNGETLYYSPLEEEKLIERDSLTICVAGERQSVLIQSREGAYFAKILPEETQS